MSPSTRRAAAALGLAVLAVACGGRADVALPDRPSGATRSFELPDPVPAVPAFRVRFTTRVADPREIQKVKGVAVVASVRTATARVRGPGGTARLRVGAVEPLRFRSVAPAATRDADFVWTTLMDGQLVLSFDSAKRLGMSDGGRVSVAGQQMPVGAFADNGVPNVVDALIATHVAERVGAIEPTEIVIGVSPKAGLGTVAGRLKRVLPEDAKVRRLLPEEPSQMTPPDAPEAVGTSEGSVIGTMRFRILKDGFIDPDQAWVDANITSASVPLIGTVTCHRVMIPQLHAALQEVVDAGLSSSIRPQDYGGCYVPRFIDRDPGKPLSMHAFGLAVDFNVSTNGLGTRGDMDPRVVEIFERWGFAWGGRWSRPDPMHFELARLIQQ